MTLGISDRLPTKSSLRELATITDPAAQEAWLDAELERLLADPVFYDTMVDFGHMWMNVPPLASVADNPEYGLVQARSIVQCPPGTLHEGKWGSPFGEDLRPCNGSDPYGRPTVIRSVEPWWAEGTTIDVLGFDGNQGPYPENIPADDPNARNDCGVWTHDHWQYEFADQPMCGCGPHMAYCFPGGSLHSWNAWLLSNPDGHRRLTWDEPARLLAHIAWHDRPLDDLIAGNYSVGPVSLQHAYVRYARRLGNVEIDQNDRWWRTSQWTSPTDPHHEATDPNAWSEFPISDRNPYLLAERDYHFDPRTEPAGEMRGVPAAGVFTMPGFLAGLTRERIRGARVLEMFACDDFAPPSPTAHFPPYTNDPAAGGPCMTCHSRIDPASIHFKRFVRNPNGPFQPAGPEPRGRGFDILGVGNNHFNPIWYQGGGPFGGDPWSRIRRLWVPGTRITPVDEVTAMAEPESVFIDFLPPEQTLYGQTSDGTVGPLGLSKLLISSGAFDRCAVRRLHQRFVGRDVDPTMEAGYLESLTRSFVESGRRIRPFVRHLMQSESFRRGL
jgi:hypothetical protein